MKKNIYTCFILLIGLWSVNMNAQENETTQENKIYHFGITANYDLGSGQLNNENAYDLNGNFNSGELLFNYILEDEIYEYRFSTGLRQTNFSTNVNLPNQESINTSLTASYLEIPLMVGIAYKIKTHNGAQESPIRPMVGLGLQSNYHLHTELKNKAYHTKNKSLGWTFNFMAKLGFEINISEHWLGEISYNVSTPLRKSLNKDETTYLLSNSVKLGLTYRF